MSHIFIAHVEEDADIALGIALGLEEAGYRTWTYEVDTVPGPSYILRTGESVAQSQAVVVIISPHSFGSNQVTKEVVRAHESSKPFIPLLRDVTHEEFQQRQPEWREAIGSAASLSIPQEGVQFIIPDIIEGLKILGIKPGVKANAARLDRIHRALNEIHALPTSSKIKTPPVKRPELETEKPKSKKLLITALASILVVVIIIEAIFLSKGGCNGNGNTANTTSTSTVTVTTTSTETAKVTSTETATITPTVTETVTPTVTATETSTITPTVTVTETSTVTATVTQTVTPPTPESKPDLIIQDITWSPKNPGRGDTVTFTITLTNPGKAQAAASYVAYYIDGVFQDTISVYSIDSGATRKVSFTWKAELGNHTIKALADFNDTVAESDDTNNEKEINFSETVAADLIIQDITWTPEIITQNEETVFSLTIINQGNGGAGSFYIHLYNDGSSESHVEVVRLLAGETATVIIRWDHYPVPDKGIHSMMFIADTYNYVPESDETNNSETIMITVS